MNWKFWKRNKLRSYKFPCSDNECLVRVACTKPCEKIEMDEDKLLDIFTELKGCPDCGTKDFYEGPSGGMSQNMKCSGCGHWFNFCLPFSIERIHIANGKFT